MKNYTFSIITISLNTKSKFIKTFSSIRKQNFKSKEIIVVDGGSNDGTEHFINKNKKKINKLIREQDRGIYDAMNKGIRSASGKYIIFLNSGDIFFKKNTLSILSKHIEDSSDIVYGNTVVNNNIKYLEIAADPSRHNFKIPFCHQSSLVKASMHKKNLFSLKYKIASDFNLICKLRNNNAKFQKIDKILTIVEGGGLSDENRIKCLFENLKIVINNNNSIIAQMLCCREFLFLFFKKIIKLIIGKNNTMKMIKIKNLNLLKF